jgi:hypothetical protein
MKKLFLTALAGLLLTLLFSPALTWCADVMLQEPTAHALPLPAMDQPSERLNPVVEPVVLPSQEPELTTGSGIDATYAVKNLLSSIMRKFPDLTLQEALSQSALLGIISETEVQLHMYGTFTTQPDPKKPGRTMRIFDTDTTHSTTSINKIARSMFDVLDDKLRSTVQESNPFCGLEGAIIAQMMQTLTTGENGIDELAKLLKNPTLITAWSNNWDTKVNAPIEDPSQKKKYSLSEFKAKIKDFVKLLEGLNKEAKTTSEKEKNVSDLSKIFMTFLSVKDQKQKATGESRAIKEYYTTLLDSPFEREQYTTEELEQIGKILLGEDSTHVISKDAKGIEDATAYLAHFAAGYIAFLEAPSGTYNSPEKNFPYCVEATVRSIMNSILYNPRTGKLDIAMLPPTIRVNTKFKDFIEKYPDPTVANYYGNSLKEWLDLVSGLDGVTYKQETGKNAYEISARTGIDNLITTLNHIFATHVDSFETLATALQVKDNGTVIREVSFILNETGFDLKVTDHKKTIVQATVMSARGAAHASFIIKETSIEDTMHLLNNPIFLKTISNLSNFAHESLYRLIFTTPSILKKVLQKACSAKNIELVKVIITFVEKQNIIMDFKVFSLKGKTILFFIIEAAFTDKSYFSAVRYLIKHNATLRKTEIDTTIFMKELIKDENLDILDYLITANTISPHLVSTREDSLLFMAIEASQFSTAELLIKHGATITEQELSLLDPEKRAVASQMIQKEEEEEKKAALPTTMSDIEPEQVEAAETTIELAEDLEQEMLEQQSEEVFL